jgi:amino acid permease
MSMPMTVIGLVNGMIGGTCLSLPLIGLKTGSITTIIVCIVTGFISYYTAYLIVLHLGKGRQIRDCVLSHFNNDYRYMTGYSFFIWISFMPVMLIYFRIICLQV